MNVPTLSALSSADTQNTEPIEAASAFIFTVVCSVIFAALAFIFAFCLPPAKCAVCSAIGFVIAGFIYSALDMHWWGKYLPPPFIGAMFFVGLQNHFHLGVLAFTLSCLAAFICVLVGAGLWLIAKKL